MAPISLGVKLEKHLPMDASKSTTGYGDVKFSGFRAMMLLLLLDCLLASRAIPDLQISKLPDPQIWDP